MATYDANIRAYPNSPLERSSLYGKFLHVLNKTGDISAATELSGLLSSRYEESVEAYLAATQLAALTSRVRSGSGGWVGRANTGTSSVGNSLPRQFSVSQNYPNPFNPSTTLRFDLPEDAHVLLVVYDVLGRKVVEMENGFRQAGYHSTTWNASGVASGVYFARFTATDASGSIRLNKVNKLVLAK